MVYNFRTSCPFSRINYARCYCCSHFVTLYVLFTKDRQILPSAPLTCISREGIFVITLFSPFHLHLDSQETLIHRNEICNQILVYKFTSTHLVKHKNAHIQKHTIKNTHSTLKDGDMKLSSALHGPITTSVIGFTIGPQG